MMKSVGLRVGPGRTVGRGWRRHYLSLIGYLLLAPLVLWIVVVLVYPLVNTVALSLTNVRIIGAPNKFVALRNYENLLGSAEFWGSVWLSVIWLVGNIVLQTLVAFAAALFLRQSWRLARQARIWVMLPWVVPTVAVAVIWQWMLNTNYGVINYLIESIGILGGPLNVFGSTTGALPGLIVTNTWHWFPLSAVVLFGAMQTIPADMYDAAKVDGAGPIAQFRYITLPSLKKVMFALGLVGGLWTFNILDVIYLITRGGPSDATTTTPVAIYQSAFKDFRVGEAAAMTIVAIVILAIAALVYVKLMAPKDASR